MSGRKRRDDLISLVLLKWQFSHLIQILQFMVNIMNHREGCDMDELFFSDATEIQCDSLRTISFRCFCNELFVNASSAVATTNIEEKKFYRYHIRGCFLIALLYDPRIQRFIMTRHHIHTAMQSAPPERIRTNHFMDRIRPLVDQFLRHEMDLESMTEKCRTMWTENHMFRTCFTVNEVLCESPSVDDLGY